MYIAFLLYIYFRVAAFLLKEVDGFLGWVNDGLFCTQMRKMNLHCSVHSTAVRFSKPYDLGSLAGPSGRLSKQS